FAVTDAPFSLLTHALLYLEKEQRSLRDVFLRSKRSLCTPESYFLSEVVPLLLPIMSDEMKGA
ncbi:MAG TPA: hypothetical protein VHV10_14525, partial [Ktedonobacteraceae bacterium]|nr:hypothetical protein [Ktedonobacteraceae bacterium]